MSHIPVNHHLRPIYRVVAALTAGWLLVFGAVGLGQTQSADWLGRGGWSAFGIPTNRAFAVVCLAAGAVILLAALVGRNVDRMVNLWGGGAFLVVGTLMMALIETESNLFNFSALTVSLAYAVGVLLLAAGLYGKVAPVEEPGSPAAGAAGERERTVPEHVPAGAGAGAGAGAAAAAEPAGSGRST